MAAQEVEQIPSTVIPTTETNEPVAETLVAKSADLEDGNPEPENSVQAPEKPMNEEIEPRVVEKVEEQTPIQKVEEPQMAIEQPTPAQKVDEPTPVQKVEEPETAIEQPTPVKKVEEPETAPAQKVEEPTPAKKVEEPQTTTEEPAPVEKVEEPTPVQKVEEPQTAIEEPTPAQKLEEPKVEKGPENNDVAEPPNPAIQTASSSAIDSALKIATEIVLEAEAASQADTTPVPDVTQSTKVVHSEGTTKTTTTLIAKLEGFSETVAETSSILAHEVAVGAQHIVEAVESHPELIAEGALAVVVGAASLVQPELIAGEIAIIGKMASDAAKKSAIKIVGDEAQKIVKAVAKDVKDSKDETKEDVKVAVAEGLATKGGVEANTDDAPLKKEPEATKDEPKADHVVSLEIAQQTPQIDLDGDGKNDVPEVPPVTLKITIGADGTVKAVTQSVTADVPVEEAKDSAAEQATQHEAVGSKELTIEDTAPIAMTEAPNTANKSSAEEPSTIEKTSSIGESNAVDLLSAKEIPVPAHEQEGELPSTDTKESAKEEIVAEIAPEATVEGVEAKEEESAAEKDQKKLTIEENMAPTATPLVETKAFQEVKPVEKVKPIEVVQPVEEVEPIEEVSPAEEIKPTEEIKPVEDIKPINEVKLIEVKKALPEGQHEQIASGNVEETLPEENIIVPTKIEDSIVDQSVPEPLDGPAPVEEKFEDKIPVEIVPETEEAPTVLKVEEPLKSHEQLPPSTSESTPEQTEQKNIVNEESEPPAAIENTDATVLASSTISEATKASSHIDDVLPEEAPVTEPTPNMPEAPEDTVGEEIGQINEDEQKFSKDLVENQGSRDIEEQQDAQQTSSIEPAAEKAEGQEEEAIPPGVKELGQLPENLPLEVHESEISAIPSDVEAEKDVGAEVDSHDAHIAEPEVASHEANISEPEVTSHEAQIAEPDVDIDVPDHKDTEGPDKEALSKEKQTENVEAKSEPNEVEQVASAPAEVTEGLIVTANSAGKNEETVSPKEVLEAQSVKPEREVALPELADASKDTDPTELPNFQDDSEVPIAHETGVGSSEPFVESVPAPEPARQPEASEITNGNEPEHKTQDDHKLAIGHKKDIETSEGAVESEATPAEVTLETKTAESEPIETTLPAITASEEEHKNQDTELVPDLKTDVETPEGAVESEAVPVESPLVTADAIVGEPAMTESPMATSSEMAPVENTPITTSEEDLTTPNSPADKSDEVVPVESTPITASEEDPTTIESQADQSDEVIPVEGAPITASEETVEKAPKRRSIWGRIFWPFGGSSKKEKESDKALSNGSESVTPA